MSSEVIRRSSRSGGQKPIVGRRKGTFRELLKSMRILRTITGLTSILVVAALVNKVSLDLLFLGATWVFVYAAVAIHNAKLDGDYDLPGYHQHVINLLVLVSFVLALRNEVIFMTFLVWACLGYIYNTISRFVLMADVTICAITHHALPAFSSAVLLGLPFTKALGIGSFFFMTCWFLIHMKNLKDFEKDAKNKYATLVVQSSDKGVSHAKRSIAISCVLMSVAYFMFDLPNLFLVVSAALVFLTSICIARINLNRMKKALDLSRFLYVTFILGIALISTAKYEILIPFLGLFTLYSPSLLTDISSDTRCFYLKRHLAHAVLP